MAPLTPKFDDFFCFEAEMEEFLKTAAELQRVCKSLVEDLDFFRRQLEKGPSVTPYQKNKLIEELEIESTKLTRLMKKTLLQITIQHAVEDQKPLDTASEKP